MINEYRLENQYIVTEYFKYLFINYVVLYKIFPLMYMLNSHLGEKTIDLLFMKLRVIFALLKKLACLSNEINILVSSPINYLVCWFPCKLFQV